VHAAREAEADGGDWRAVVDGLRPVIQSLWRSLSETERRRFLSRAARLWEVHRHRMAPAVAATVDDFVQAGRLVVRRGTIDSLVAEGPTLRVGVRSGSDRPQELRVGHIVNCTGPSTDVATTSDPLLRGMLAAGVARPDPLGLGFDVNDTGALIGAGGTPSPVLSTLGPLCRGRLWETTAVPEIRDQACALAARLVGERRSAAV